MGLTEDKIRTSFDLKKLGNLDSCRPLDQGIESRNFLLSTISNKYILKSYKNTSINEIIFEVSLLKNLAHFKNKFPSPIDKIFYIDSSPCVLYKFIDGHGLTQSDINIPILQKIAKLQALVHKDLANFTPEGDRERFSIFDLSFVSTFRCDYSPEDALLIKNCRDWLKDRLERCKSSDLLKSIIHEDLEMENILVDKKGDINFIDFGESHKGEIISDIAIAIKELVINNFGTDKYNFIEAYLDAYEENNPIIDVVQIKVLYTLFVRRGLFMFTYFLNKQAKSKNLPLSKRIKTERIALKSLLLHNNLERKILNFNYDQ